MESIDSEIVHNDYDGLSTREARRRLAKDKYEESKEAAELRFLAQAAVLKKSKEEREAQARDVDKDQTKQEKTPREQFVEAELEAIAQTLAPEELHACVLDFVQVFVEITPHTSISVRTQFPEGYPNRGLFVDVKSKYLDAELLEKLKTTGETEANKRLGQQQVLAVIDRLRSILTVNRLAPAFSDLKQLKEYLAGHDDCSLKSAKEKSGSVSVSLKAGRYFLDLNLVVPVGYPVKPLEIQRHSSNLPPETLSLFLTAAKEKARNLSELPTFVEDAGRSGARDGAGSGAESKSEVLSQSQTLASRNRVGALATQAQETQQRAAARRKELEETFVSRPSLFPVVEFLYEQCLAPLATGLCRVCEKQLLPSDPSLTSKIPKSMATLKVYCGHMYHFKCVESYVSRPPFGKKCLHCDKKIQHSRLMTDEKILEQRWTHQQARQREIEDVAEFMSL